ncbi:methyl-accepting chemotaxis protein [Brevibacillus fulvus]|uniref:Methyl-accepting chemotaxis protein n=1 Tax=Brevibacillus fulvus TaxID=1125967 RepID=A0A938XW20_9BACL|nr:methyl-accepting chemotaxis protein [Brevibacillus fulvus]MBM7589149.1 methyl-accepting chemotaxis protein [Brevibacillus fulvus]
MKMKSFKLPSLQTINGKLIIWLLIIGLVPMGVATTIMYQQSTAEIMENEQTSMQVLAENTAQSMQQWLEIRQAELQLAAKTDNMRSLDPQQQIRLVNTLKEQSQAYEAVLFTDEHGIVRAHTRKESINVMNLADRDYFKKGMQGQASFSDVIVSKGTGKRITPIATPVLGQDGQVHGVLSASVQIDTLIDKFLSAKTVNSNGMYPILVDNLGVIQYHPNQELIGKKTTEAGFAPDMVSLMETGSKASGSAVIDDHGETAVVAYAPLEINGFSVYLHVPQQAILSATVAMKMMAIWIAIVAALLIIIVAWLIARSISRPIRVVSEQVKKIAEGDLTGNNLALRRKDELGQLAQHINHMKESLKEFIGQVHVAADYVAESAGEFTANAEQLSKTTEQITISMQHVSEGAAQQSVGVNTSVIHLDELSRGVQQIADSSASIAEASGYTIQKATNGGEAVEKTVSRMQSIHAAVTDTDQLIRLLEERSTEIGEISEVITGIAGQTNLLALNAAIEAARAGEHGRGFAVVADEVRKLAEESQVSSSKIAQLIEQIQQDMVRSLEAMRHVKEQVEDGLHAVRETDSHFYEIVKSAQDVTDQIREMAAISEEMAAGTQQVTSSFSEIARITDEANHNTQEVAAATEEQLASMEEITSSAQTLNMMAAELRDKLSKFRVE